MIWLAFTLLSLVQDLEYHDRDFCLNIDKSNLNYLIELFADKIYLNGHILNVSQGGLESYHTPSEIGWIKVLMQEFILRLCNALYPEICSQKLMNLLDFVLLNCENQEHVMSRFVDAYP